MLLNADYRKRTVFLTIEHLNKKPRWMVEKGIMDFYDLRFKNLHSDVRSAFNSLRKRGFSLVLQHENKNLILCFNES